MGDYIVLFRNWRDYIATVPAQDMDAMERAAGTKSIKIINYVYIPFFGYIRVIPLCLSHSWKSKYQILMKLCTLQDL